MDISNTELVVGALLLLLYGVVLGKYPAQTVSATFFGLEVLAMAQMTPEQQKKYIADKHKLETGIEFKFED